MAMSDYPPDWPGFAQPEDMLAERGDQPKHGGAAGRHQRRQAAGEPFGAMTESGEGDDNE